MKITNKLKLALKSILSLKFGEIVTDKATLVFDGEELTVGTEVFTMGENDEPVVAEDGEYVAENGDTIVVAEGKVAEIKPKEEDTPAVSEDEAKFNSQKVEMSASYDEIRRNIQEAINKTGVNGWIVEAAADYAIVNVWTGDKEVYFRYELTTNEDGSVILGASTEVKPAFVPAEEAAEPAPAAEETPAVEPTQMTEETPAADPVDEPEVEEEKPEDRIAALEATIAEVKGSLEAILNGVKSLEGRMDEVETTVAKVAQEPAAEPVEETPVEETKMSRLSYLRKK